MDTITHIMTAFCFVLVYEKLSKSEIKIPLILLFFGAAAPDFDYFFNLINCQIVWLNHRGMFHSFIGIIPVLLLTTLFFNIPFIKKLFKLNDSILDCFLLLYAGFLIHIIFDLSAPAMLFFPFSISMVGLNLNPIIPYSITFCLIIISLVLFYRKQKYEQGIAVFFIAGLLLIVLLIPSIIWAFGLYSNASLILCLITLCFNFLFLEAFSLKNVVKN